jgi:hypothetical protein
MAQVSEDASSSDQQIEVDLRNPVVAALWAWIWPGAGHMYQRRYAKGTLFMVCVLGIYFFGLSMCSGHVVYASWRQSDKRWQYICQLGVGAPALPALVQSHQVRNNRKPFANGFMAPPAVISADSNAADDLSDLHLQYHTFFEMGTLYTMIAGLLNVLAIYDAYAGPVIVVSKDDSDTDKPPPKDD